MTTNPKRFVHIIEVGRREDGKGFYRILDQEDQQSLVIQKNGWLVVYSQTTRVVVEVRKDKDNSHGSDSGTTTPKGKQKKMDPKLTPLVFKIRSDRSHPDGHVILIKYCDENGKNCVEGAQLHVATGGPVMRVDD